jgi:hypothetical protein
MATCPISQVVEGSWDRGAQHVADMRGNCRKSHSTEDYQNDPRFSQQPSHQRYYSRQDSAPAVLPVQYDISPPSSPDLRPAHREPGPPSSGRVSPIEALPTYPASIEPPTSRFTTHIPIPRKAAPSASSSARNSVLSPDKDQPKMTGKRQTRWDLFSGEPTTGARGKTGQIKPEDASNRFHDPPVSGVESSYRASISAGTGKRVNPYKKPSLAERAAKLGARVSNTEPKVREPWKGASGRSAIVAPVTETTGRRSRPLEAHRNLDAQMSTPARRTPSPRSIPLIPGPIPEPAPEPKQPEKDLTIKPVVPLKTAGTQSPAQPASPVSSNPPRNPQGYPSPVSPGREQLSQPNPDTNSASQHLQEQMGEYNASQQLFPTEPPRKSAERNMDQQSSRFSWTTSATGTSFQPSPPPSPPPEMPKRFAPTSSPAPTSAAAAVTSPPLSPAVLAARERARARTEGRPESIVSVTQRKPVPSQASTARPDSTVRPDMERKGSEDKALPVPPSQRQPEDLISNLQSQLDDIEERKRPIRRRMAELTQTGNPVVYDLTTRKEHERKIRGLEDVLADLSRQEHEVGLRLHRAWKRRDREAYEQPTALWVRRVTG